MQWGQNEKSFHVVRRLHFSVISHLRSYSSPRLMGASVCPSEGGRTELYPEQQQRLSLIITVSQQVLCFFLFSLLPSFAYLYSSPSLLPSCRPHRVNPPSLRDETHHVVVWPWSAVMITACRPHTFPSLNRNLYSKRNCVHLGKDNSRHFDLLCCAMEKRFSSHLFFRLPLTNKSQASCHSPLVTSHLAIIKSSFCIWLMPTILLSLYSIVACWSKLP